MTKPQLDELKLLCEEILNKRSDDFGHNVQLLLEWQALKGDELAMAIPKLIDRIEKLERALELAKQQRNENMYDRNAELMQLKYNQEIDELLK